jgi:hypothetical protein
MAPPGQRHTEGEAVSAREPLYQYRVVELSKRGDLETVVSLAMKEGWEPQGGVAICQQGDGEFIYLQAMVRHREGASQ